MSDHVTCWYCPTCGRVRDGGEHACMAVTGEPTILPPASWDAAIETADPGARFAEQPGGKGGDLTDAYLTLQGVLGIALHERFRDGLAVTTEQLERFRRNEGPAYTTHDGQGVKMFFPAATLADRLRENGLPVPLAPEATP